MSILKKILIVDDDVISNRVITATLTAAAYKVESLDNAAAAWELLCQQPHDYSLVLVDRMMMGMDGMMLLHRIRTHPQFQNLPVVMITGEAEPEEYEAAIAAGAFDFIYKPIEKELLLSIITKAISHNEKK